MGHSFVALLLTFSTFTSRDTASVMVTMVTPKATVVISFFHRLLNVAGMAFFGLTNMGHQNPIGDKMIGSYRRASPPQGKICWTPEYNVSSQMAVVC